jgi:hypothetical protein
MDGSVWCISETGTADTAVGEQVREGRSYLFFRHVVKDERTVGNGETTGGVSGKAGSPA